MLTYHEKLSNDVPGVGKTWDETWKPEVISTNVPLKTADWSALSDEEIRSYLRLENPLDCAGSFKIEGLGIALMAGMAGEDYTALIGLPLIKLTDMLAAFGVRVLTGDLGGGVKSA